MSLRFRVLSTPQGYVAFVASPRGLRRVVLPKRSRAAAVAAVRRECPEADEDSGLLPAFARALKQYFEGREVRFDVRLDCEGIGAFTSAVWQACCGVEYGRVVSYGELARRAGRPRAARAVGAAMARNRCPIVVPCHRVLKSDGSIGGWSGPGGLALKRRLLAMESAAGR